MKYEEGMTVIDIAAITGISQTVVRAFISKNRISEEQERMDENHRRRIEHRRQYNSIVNNYECEVE